MRLPARFWRHGGELAKCVYADLAKFHHLVGRDARDVAQMVVIAAAFLAKIAPATDVAVQGRLGVGGIGPKFAGPFQRRFSPSVVGSKISHPKCLWVVIGPRHDNISILRLSLLCRGQKIGIETELKDRASFCLTG